MFQRLQQNDYSITPTLAKTNKNIEADKGGRFAYPFARELCCLLLALSILAGCYIHYRSEIFDQGSLAISPLNSR